MLEQIIVFIMENHRGKALGLILGLLVGILIISYGFWKAMFIVVCIVLGFIIGKAVDDNADFDNWFDKFKGR
ncbi:MAG: DUF2273 domain-containing protein [Candidatus Saccharibacteria bacterium]